jgi:N-acetylglutamate synthase
MVRSPSMPVVLSNDALGRRVSVRYRRRGQQSGPPLTDVVGVLLAADAQSLTVLGRTGPVRLDRSEVVIAREVQPSRREILNLEAIAARGWQAAEVVESDGWLLRADHGWTGRANSALALWTPTRPLTEQLAFVADFYRDRGLPVQIMVPMPARELLDGQLASAAWPAASETIVMTRAIPGPMPEATPAVPHGPGRLSLTAEPVPEWQRGYTARDGVLPPHALALLSRHERVAFVSCLQDDQTLGIARGVVDDGWLGITMVETAPAARRTGIATTMMRTLYDWSRAHGGRLVYLQVEAANKPAQAFYRQLGYAEHHRYHYRQAPA